MTRKLGEHPPFTIKDVMQESRPNAYDTPEEVEGYKLDDHKLDPTLVPVEMIEAAAHVMQHALTKYPRDNWKKVNDARQRYTAALWRHLIAMQRGEEMDPDSGQPHLWHVAANVSMLCWFDAVGTWGD